MTEITIPANELDEEGEERLYQTLRHFWHPVLRSEDLAERPQRVTLFEQDLVIVRLGGQVRAFNDLCVHRGAALSLGFVEDGCLRCAYHGFKYDPDGVCVEVPSQPGLSKLVNARIPRYQAEERYGLVWVCMVDTPHFPIPDFPQYDDPQFRWVNAPPYEWRCASPRRLENFVDFGHFSWVHDGLLGSREHPEVAEHDVWREGAEIRCVQWVTEPVTSEVKAHLGTTGDMIRVRNEYRITIPHTVNLDRHFEGGGRYILVMICSPVGRKRTNSFWYLGRNYALEPEKDEEFLSFEQVILDQDRPIVESQRPEQLSTDISQEMHIKVADRLSLEYRRWLVQLTRELSAD